LAEGADYGGNNSSGGVGNEVGVESSGGRGAGDWERYGGGGGGSCSRMDEKNDGDGEDAPAKYSEDAWGVGDNANVARGAIHWDSSSSSAVHDAAGEMGKAREINTDDSDDIDSGCGRGFEVDGAADSLRNSWGVGGANDV